MRSDRPQFSGDREKIQKVEDLVRTGMGPEEAFQKVTIAMGQADDIGREFYKAHTTRRSGMSEAEGFIPFYVNFPGLFMGKSIWAMIEALGPVLN